jgi:hypothetical protein
VPIATMLPSTQMTLPRFFALQHLNLLAYYRTLHRFHRNLLSLVGGNGRSVDSVAYASDAPSDDKLSSRTTSNWYAGNLDDNSNNHDAGSEEDRVAPTEFVADQENEAGTQEAADGVDGDHKTLVCTVIFDFGKCGDKCRGADNSGHDTLIVTKE